MLQLLVFEGYKENNFFLKSKFLNLTEKPLLNIGLAYFSNFISCLLLFHIKLTGVPWKHTAVLYYTFTCTWLYNLPVILILQETSQITPPLWSRLWTHPTTKVDRVDRSVAVTLCPSHADFLAFPKMPQTCSCFRGMLISSSRNAHVLESHMTCPHLLRVSPPTSLHFRGPVPDCTIYESSPELPVPLVCYICVCSS